MADKPTSAHLPSIDFGGASQSTQSPSRPAFAYLPLPTASRPLIMANSDNILPPLESLRLKEPPKKTCDISNLMSPPNHPMENFHQNPVVAMVGLPKDGVNGQSSRLPMLSPPISPVTDSVDLNASPATPAQSSDTDPILFPSPGNLAAISPPSLFGSDTLDERQRAIERHVATREDTLFTTVSPPKHQDYHLALTFRVDMMRHVQKDPRRWLKRCKQQLKADADAREKYRNRSRFQPIQPARPAAVKAPRPVKPDTAVAKPSALRPIRSKNSVQKPARQSGSPEPRRAPSSREDKDFNSLPDFCPPQSSLNERTWDLDKIDWKGAAIDLTGDPHAHLLHPEEIQLASRLRLDCATYLTNKRRLFERRLECARINKEFRKTDAQQACKIDVNKASRLWMAYNMADWLLVKYVEPFLAYAKSE